MHDHRSNFETALGECLSADHNTKRLLSSFVRSQDFNDHAPIFVIPTGNQTIRVYENATIDSEVTRVKAVDVDVGSNGAVRYRLRQDPIGNHRSFSIDEITGVITLRRDLDRERQKIYVQRVEAHDLGVPTQLQVRLDAE